MTGLSATMQATVASGSANGGAPAPDETARMLRAELRRVFRSGDQRQDIS